MAGDNLSVVGIPWGVGTVVPANMHTIHTGTVHMLNSG